MLSHVVRKKFILTALHSNQQFNLSALLQGKLETKQRIIVHSQQDVATFICDPFFAGNGKTSQRN